MIDTATQYDEEYFERGLQTGKSLYESYHWMPELTIRMAHHLIDYLRLDGDNRILDFGCAKGYLVRALRLLDINAYGCDASEYAIANADPNVKTFCKLMPSPEIPFPFFFDCIITKDVLEHIPEQQLDRFLSHSTHRADRSFHVVPLGGADGYVVPAYNKDPTHVICKPKSWWIDKFALHGWRLENFSFEVRGIKENWTSKYPVGNGFFTLKRIGR